MTPKILLKVCEPAPNSGVFVLPMRDCSRAAHTLYDDVVVRGNVILIERRAERRANAARFQQIFVRYGQAVQRSECFAMRLHLICFRRGVRGHLRGEGYDGVYFWIYALDLIQVRGEGFARGQLFLADESRHFDGAEETDGGIGDFSLAHVREFNMTPVEQASACLGLSFIGAAQIHKKTG